MQAHNTSIEISPLESFQFPKGKEAGVQEGRAQEAIISSIVSVASHTFIFRENANTPGRELEASVVVNVPSGAGFFTSISNFTGAFTSPDFQVLTERPLGQFEVGIGLRGNNFVCRVRLTDANADDAIVISVTGVIAFFQ